jgi:UDP-glucose 4-epimerase
MTVLVTGGAGYIGSHMVWELLEAGEEVVVLDRLSTGFEWAVAPEAELIVGDVADKELTARIIREKGVDAIIHFAGSIVVPESVADPLAYYENNTCKTRSLIETAVRGGGIAQHPLAHQLGQAVGRFRRQRRILAHRFQPRPAIDGGG